MNPSDVAYLQEHENIFIWATDVSFLIYAIDNNDSREFLCFIFIYQK